jgi:hypothetical protein
MKRATLLLLLLAACSSKQEKLEQRALSFAESLEPIIHRHVKDDQRAQVLLDAQRRIHETTVGFVEEMEAVRKDWSQVNRNYDSTPASFAALRNRSAGARRRGTDEVIRQAMRARKAATREEWEAMAKEVTPK